MTEWGIYLVIVSLLATAGMIAKPISALTRTNTKLECAIEKLTDAMRDTKKKLEAHSGYIERHDVEIKHLKEKGRKKAV